MKAQETLFNQILDTLDSVDPQQWEFYLKDGANASMLPYNPISKTTYKGTNKFSLWLFSFFGIFKSNFYATFKQITQAGGKLKKGSKAVDVLFYSISYKEKEGKKFISQKEYLQLSEQSKEAYKKYVTARIFKVFNFDYIENVDEMNLDIVNFDDELNMNDEINILISGTDAKIEHGAFSYGSYVPSLDLIRMPETKYFKDETKYYSTLLHELVHWTGHKERLNRECLNSSSSDKNKYSYEELIAELGSIVLYTDYNLFSELKNSCRYLKGWLTKIEGDRDTMHKAFKDANKAVGFIKNVSLKGNKLKVA